MLTVIPDYIDEGVEQWLNDLDKQMDSPMTKEDREHNREMLVTYCFKFNRLPPMEETIKQLKFAKEVQHEK